MAYAFRDRKGKTYSWGRSELADTLFEGEDWDRPSVKQRALALKPGQSMTIKGERLTRVPNASPREQIRGGLSSGMDPSEFDQAQLDKGTLVELEHVARTGRRPTAKDRRVAREIAMDHLVEHPRYYDFLEDAERKMKRSGRRTRVPLLRKQEAIRLATDVALKGWKRHGPKAGIVGYWEKEVPGGHMHVIESPGVMRKYALQYVSDDGDVTKLGTVGKGSSVEDAQVRAVLEATSKGIRVVNPQRIRKIGRAACRER